MYFFFFKEEKNELGNVLPYFLVNIIWCAKFNSSFCFLFMQNYFVMTGSWDLFWGTAGSSTLEWTSSFRTLAKSTPVSYDLTSQRLQLNFCNQSEQGYIVSLCWLNSFLKMWGCTCCGLHYFIRIYFCLYNLFNYSKSLYNCSRVVFSKLERWQIN